MPHESSNLSSLDVKKQMRMNFDKKRSLQKFWKARNFVTQEKPRSNDQTEEPLASYSRSVHTAVAVKRPAEELWKRHNYEEDLKNLHSTKSLDDEFNNSPLSPVLSQSTRDLTRMQRKAFDIKRSFNKVMKRINYDVKED